MFRHLIISLLWGLSAVQLLAADFCNLFDVLRKDRSYYEQLLESWPKSIDSSISNEVGISLASPKKILAMEVIGTSWKGDVSSEAILELATKEITLVNWESFQENFKKSINLFKTAVGDREYALAVPKNKKSKPPKSNHYFSGKALVEEGLRPSKVIYKASQLKGIKDVVIIDDGAFSGNQLADLVQSLGIPPAKGDPVSNFAKMPLIHLVIPYASDAARLQVRTRIKDNYRVRWYNIEKIRVTRDVNWPIAVAEDIQKLHLTVFQHKLPDFVSTFPVKVLADDGRWYTNDPRISFEESGIRQFKPAYKDDISWLSLTDMMEMLEVLDKDMKKVGGESPVFLKTP